MPRETALHCLPNETNARFHRLTMVNMPMMRHNLLMNRRFAKNLRFWRALTPLLDSDYLSLPLAVWLSLCSDFDVPLLHYFSCWRPSTHELALSRPHVVFSHTLAQHQWSSLRSTIVGS